MTRRRRVPPTLAKPAEDPPQVVEMQIPTLQITLNDAHIEVQQRGEHKVLVIGPVALVIGVPFDSDAAKRLGGALIGSGIEIPSGAVVERVGATRA